MSTARFYECILIIRPDVSTKYVFDLSQEVKAHLEKSGGKVHDAEYWGFKTLAYRIQKRGKAHYVCLGIETNDLKGLDHFLRFHRDLLRFSCIRAEHGLKFPTPLFHSSLDAMAAQEGVTTGEPQ